MVRRERKEGGGRIRKKSGIGEKGYGRSETDFVRQIVEEGN
jgi:hypothetical protein